MSTHRPTGRPPTRAGTYVVTVRATIAAERRLAIIVAKRLANSSPAAFALGHRGHVYAVVLNSVGGDGRQTWTKASSVLPTGLRSSSSLAGFGIAAKVGSFVITVRARDVAGRVATKRVTIVIRV